MNNRFNYSKMFNIFIIIGVAITLVSLLYYNYNASNPLTIYLIIPLSIAVGFLLGSLYFYYKHSQKQKEVPQEVEEVNENWDINSNAIFYEKVRLETPENNGNALQSKDELIMDWGNKILNIYSNFYNTALRIFPDFKEIMLKSKIFYIRVDLFWKFDSKKIEIGFSKTMVADEKKGGVFLGFTIENLDLDTECLNQDSRTFEVTDFTMSLKKMVKLLNYYSADAQAKYLIQNDLSEYARRKKISYNLILKKLWIEMERK